MQISPSYTVKQILALVPRSRVLGWLSQNLGRPQQDAGRFADGRHKISFGVISLADISLQTTAETARTRDTQPFLQDGKGKGMVAKVRTVAYHGVEVIEVETQMTIASDPSCYLLFSRPGIEQFQSVDPDPFCLARAIRAGASPREAPAILAAGRAAFPIPSGACPILRPGR